MGRLLAVSGWWLLTVRLLAIGLLTVRTLTGWVAHPVIVPLRTDYFVDSTQVLAALSWKPCRPTLSKKGESAQISDHRPPT
jgi:hypothetical protein